MSFARLLRFLARKPVTFAPKCWIDGQFLVIDISTFKVSHKETPTYERLAATDDMIISEFLGRLLQEQHRRGTMILDTSDEGVAQTGLTQDCKHLKVAVHPDTQPATIWLQASNCWKAATGRKLGTLQQCAPRS